MDFPTASLFPSSQHPRIWPPVWGVAGGIIAGRCGCATGWGWAALAIGVAVLAAQSFAVRMKWPAVLALAAACIGCFGIGLLRESTQASRVPDNSILRFVGEESRLLRVEGVVADLPQAAQADGGELGRFGHEGPSMGFTLRTQSVEKNGKKEPSEGLLRITVQGDADLAGVRPGVRVGMVGWVHPLRPPENPGTFDYAAHARQKGVVARLTVADGGSLPAVRVLEAATAWGLPNIRARSADLALASLRLGLHGGGPVRTALIEALLLGARGGGMAELEQDFQQAGLAHILAISGANVAIFLTGVWLLGRLVSGRPARVAVAVLAVVLLFLLAVPDDLPILRSGLMAVVLAVSFGLGRPVSGLQALGVSALTLLLWRPEELFSAGFQLSFAAIGALFLFSRPIAVKVEDWLTGALPVESDEKKTPGSALAAWRMLRHWMIEGAVASVVVYLAILPVLLLQFDQVSPLAALFSMVTSPIAALLMWVGYAKIALGLLWAPLGAGLAWPVESLAAALAWVVHGAAHLPGASVALVKPAGLGFALAAAAGLWSALAAWAGMRPLPVDASLARRRRALAWPWMAVALALGLLAGEQVWALRALRGNPGLRVHELSVADGSCILFETRSSAVLFDCGSRTLARQGARAAVPALRRLGVRRLDAVVVSHADLDHFGGMLDVADAFPVAAAYIGPSVQDDAVRDPQGASAAFLAGLARRGIRCKVVQRGWFLPMGEDALLEALWPAADFAASHTDNDRSVVLSARCGPRSALFCGDLEKEGLRGLFAAEADLKADAADLPHHGGFVSQSAAWLAKVAPGVVVQSASMARYESENSRQWGPLLAAKGCRHWVTGRDGMVSLFFTPEGEIRAKGFLPAAERTGPSTAAK